MVWRKHQHIAHELQVTLYFSIIILLCLHVCSNFSVYKTYVFILKNTRDDWKVWTTTTIMIFRNSNDHCRKTNLLELFNEQLNRTQRSTTCSCTVSYTVHSSELLSLNPQHISHNGLIRFPECHPNQSLRHSNQGSCQALKPIQRIQSVCKTLHATMF